MKVFVIVEIVEGVMHAVRAYPETQESEARLDLASCLQENEGNTMDYDVGFFEREV